MKGLAHRTGKQVGEPALLSRDFLTKRSRSMGEAEVADKKEETLPDGRKRIEVIYTFEDINKVHVWSLPTMRYMRPGGKEKCLDGRVKFDYQKGPRDTTWGDRFREELYIPTLLRNHHLAARKPLSPAARREFEEITTIYQDMLKDLYVSIEIIPPIERFEERGMVRGMPVEGQNRVVLLKIDGRTLTDDPEVLYMFLANAMPSGGYLQSQVPRRLRGAANPWFHNYHHKFVRFFKVEKLRR
jgi:hypothetical protein